MAQSITLQTSDNNVQESDVLGRLSFAASSESSGSDAILIGASIYAMAESDFTEIANATSIIFATSTSESAIAKLKISSQGHFLPLLNKTYDIGASGTKFRNVYAENGNFENVTISNLSDPYEILYITDASGTVSSTDLLKVDTANGDLKLNGDIVGTGDINLTGSITANSGTFTKLNSNQLVLVSGAPPSPTPSSIYNLSGVLYYQNNPIAILPTGGTSNQTLQKISDTSYDLQWIDNYATELHAYVKNTTGSGLFKGQAVYINGAQGDHPTITLAIANGEPMSSKTLGLLKQDLAINEFGFVVTEGTLNQVDTSSADAAGDPIWLSPTTPGGLVYGTANKPLAPDHLVFLGYVIVKQQNAGKIFVKVQNGFELGELHNVGINGTSNGSFLQYNTASGLWVASTSGNFTTLGVSTQTANTIASFDSNKNVVSLSTATYPSLTELSYVKGVTSAIQTQIDSKAATSTTITAGSGLAGGGSLAANRTIDIGQGDGITVSADSIAVDSTVVRTTGVQTISGSKTFTAATVFSTGVTISSSGTSVPLTITNDGTGNSFVVNDITGDTSPFVIDSSGNVGIGTTTPTFVNNTYAGLHIHAATATSLKLTNTATGQTSTDGFELLQDAAGNAYIWNRENTNISIATSGTSRITITNDGKVGIGVTPASAGSSALQVRGDLDIFGNGSDRSITYNMGVGDDGITGWYRSKIAFIPSSATNKISQHIAFFNKDGDLGGSTLTERMRITTAGNVGIGTASPQQKFVVSNSGAEGMEIIPALNSNESRIQTYNRSTSAWNKFSINCSTFELFTNGGTTTIFGDSSGNVGIGTSSVSSGFKVDIRGRILSYTTASDGLITVQGLQTASAGTGKSAIQIDVNGNGGFAWQNDASSGTRILKLLENSGYGSGDSELIRVLSGGDVLIGTTTDQGSFRLQVANNAWMDNLYLSTTTNWGRLAINHNGVTTFAAGFNNTDTSSTGQTTVNILRNGTSVGSISTTNAATSYNTNSDYRLKNNVTNMVGASVRLLLLRPVTFEWKVGGSGEGFIAHELAEAVPLAVTGEKDAKDSYGMPIMQSVDHSKLVPLLVSALQEVYAEIADIKSRLSSLEQK